METIMPQVRVKGSELPLWIQNRYKLDPTEAIEITVHVKDDELTSAQSLDEVMDIMSERAQSRGLTSEHLDTLLNASN